MVILFLALATILVTNLAHSTFLQSESVGFVERRLKGEYLLKSLVNFAAGLIAADSYSNIDSAQEPWGPFIDGMEIPPDLAAELGVNDPGARAALQITPVTGGFKIYQVLGQSSMGNSAFNALIQKQRKICLRLFQILGFDDKLLEPDHTGLFEGRKFSAAETISNLIDYLDNDQESFKDPFGTLPDGIEGELPDKSLFRNDGVIGRLGELSSIPGFTPNRLKALWPHITTEGKGRININVAPVEVLQALDEQITPEIAQAIYDFARSEKGPFQSAREIENIPGVPQGLYGNLASIIDVAGNRYQVIARVSYPGQAPLFIQAVVTKEFIGEDPKITNVVLY